MVGDGTTMKLNQILNEAAYPGNIGAMEVFKFYRIASDREKEHFDELLKKDDYDAAWGLIQQVTGVTLYPMGEDVERFSDPITSITIQRDDRKSQTYQVVKNRPSRYGGWDYLVQPEKGYPYWIHHDEKGYGVYRYTGKNGREIQYMGKFIGKERETRLAIA